MCTGRERWKILVYQKILENIYSVVHTERGKNGFWNIFKTIFNLVREKAKTEQVAENLRLANWKWKISVHTDSASERHWPLEQLTVSQKGFASSFTSKLSGIYILSKDSCLFLGVYGQTILTLHIKEARVHNFNTFFSGFNVFETMSHCLHRLKFSASLC